jgi:hypothetical protein
MERFFVRGAERGFVPVEAEAAMIGVEASGLLSRADIVTGGDAVIDTAMFVKCTLKSIDQRDYYQPVRLDKLTRGKVIFPEDVCDYSRPGVVRYGEKAVPHRF